LSLLNVKFLIKKPGRRAGRVAQVEDCLTSKCETLSSNPSTTKKKKKKENLEEKYLSSIHEGILFVISYENR
jgi:hypothetical protein